jgi:tellurite resistance protein
MPVSEEMAYALATWARFDDDVSDALLRAVCGAFAIIASADGDVAEAEIERFLQVVRTRADAFPALDLRRLEASFRDLGQALLTDPDEGRRRALAAIAAVRGEPKHCDLVLAAARIAVVADDRVQGCEKQVLADVGAALGMAASG